MVGVLVAKGADVAVVDQDGLTPLHLAAFTGRADMVGALLRSGADVAAVDIYGETALHLAARGGHANVVELLLKAGAAVDGGGARSPLSVALNL